MFNKPLYIEAVEVVLSSPQLEAVILRLGGFHFVMSYMGSIGCVTSVAVIDTCWEMAYELSGAWMTGHKYSRGLLGLTCSRLHRKCLVC